MTDSATALLNLQRYFGFRSIREMAQATGIDRSALTRAMNAQKPRKLARESRLRLARFLGRACESPEQLQQALHQTGWVLSEEELTEALSWMRRECLLFGVPLFPEEGHFVGRSREQATLLARLTDRRTTPTLVVVRGLPGVGKSRLVAHVAHHARPLWQRYPDGIFWLDLENGDERQAISRLLRDLRGTEGSTEPEDLWRAATHALKGKQALLILDGAEEVDLERWTGLVSNGGLLVTTRRSDIGGPEVQFPLDPMPLGEGRELLLRDHPAVDVGEPEIRWVVEAVGGLPLALYILGRLAFWHGSLRPVVKELQAHLMDTLEIGERKRENVRVAFQMSYERLSEDGKKLFRFLVGFPQPFPGEVVAYVLGWEERRVRRAFLELVRAGLARSEGGERYTMHALLVEYARDQLTDEDRAQFAQWMTGFAGYYGERTTQAHHLWLQGETRQAQRLWEEHLPYILQGFKYAVSLGRREWVLEYLRRTGPFLALQFRREELRQWWEAAQKLATHDSERMEIHLLCADWWMQTGMIREALELARQARTLAEEIRSPHGRRQAMLIEAQACLILGHIAEANSLLWREEWESWMEEASPLDPILYLLWHLRGAAAEATRNMDTAQKCYLIALQLLENALRQSIPWALWPAAEIAWRMGALIRSTEPQAALAFCETGMALAQKAGIRRAWIPSALLRASILAQLGQLDQAEAAMKEVLPVLGHEPLYRMLWAEIAAELAWRKKDWETAEREYQIAMELAQGQAAESEIWRLYGDCLQDQGKTQSALAAWKRAAETARQAGHPHFYAMALLRIGECLWKEGNREEAIPLLQDVIRLGGEMDNPLLVAWVYEATDQPEEAKRFYDMALSLRILTWTDIAEMEPGMRWLRLGFLPPSPGETVQEERPVLIPIDDVFQKLAFRLRQVAWGYRDVEDLT
jgi:tetratricopeptide (TPR) repeat protein